MKRIVSVLITILLISNIFQSTLITNASDASCSQEPFVTYDALVTGNSDVTPNITDAGFIDIMDGAPLYPIFEKRNYMTNELISVQLELTASLVGVDTTYDTSGFSVIGDISSSFNDCNCQTYTVVLAYDGVTPNPYFTFGVVTNDGSTVYTKVYGHLSNYGLFLSDSSHDAARELSYYHLVELGILTPAEYNQILQNEYSQLGVEIIHDVARIDPVLTQQYVDSSEISTISSATATTITGYIGWTDDNGVTHPMQYNRVEIWDSVYDEHLGTAYTNEFGDYVFTFNHTVPYHNIYVKIYPGGRNSIVKTGNGGDYVYTSGTVSNIAPGSNICIGWTIDMTSDLGRAFQISQAINVATEYVKQMNNAYIAPVTVKYPHVENSSSCFYRSSEDTIYIRSSSADSGYPESYAAWDVIMHEYGHHVQAEFGISRSPGGQHSFNSNLADTRNSKDIGIRLAWGEAYASVFGGMAQAYYSSSLQNIFTVGDTAYLSYNTVTIDYETTAKQTGEACEATIIGILWDLYDNTASESHDTVSFSHSAYWDMITNCNSENLSEFCNYYNSRYSTSKALALGKILSYYKVSASELSANIGGTTPTFNWTANGTSSTLPNNKFDLIFLTANNYVTLRINDITSTTYTLSNDEWETVLNSYGTTYSVVVIAYQTSAPSTGGYYSELLNVYKPTYNESSSITHNNVESRRYSEKIINLTPGSYYDLYVTFGTTGLKLIQTFGITDTALELYSASGTLLIGANETDDDGFALNALIQCDVTANTQYIIRIRCWNENKYGTTKISMTPGSCGTNTIECYEDIMTITSTTTNWNSYTQLDHTSVVVFKPSITGSYTFELISGFDSYLYVIDPRSTNSLIRYTDFDDDSGDALNGKLMRSLDAGVRYFIIYSGYNIENENHVGNITLKITAH